MKRAILFLLLAAISAHPSVRAKSKAPGGHLGRLRRRVGARLAATHCARRSHSSVHANEHMGQLIAYARMSGVVPPWSNTQ